MIRTFVSGQTIREFSDERAAEFYFSMMQQRLEILSGMMNVKNGYIEAVADLCRDGVALTAGIDSAAWTGR